MTPAHQVLLVSLAGGGEHFAVLVQTWATRRRVIKC